MNIFNELLESYSLLRKRRYSLSEAIVNSGGGSTSLALNAQFPEGDGSTPELLQQLLKITKAGGLQAEPHPVSKFMAFQSPETPGSVVWFDMAGEQHAANAEDLIEYLELRLKEGEEAPPGEEDGAPVGIPLAPPRFSKAIGDLVEAAEAFGMDVKSTAFEERLNEEMQGIDDTLNLKGTSSNLRKNLTALAQARSEKDITPTPEDIQEEVDEITKDFSDFAKLLKDLGSGRLTKKGYADFNGSKRMEELTSRFFLRERGRSLRYGLLSKKSRFDAPLVSKNLPLLTNVNISTLDNRYSGVALFNSRRVGGSAFLELLNLPALKEIKDESGLPVVKSTTSGKSHGFPYHRSVVSEGSEVVGDAFLKSRELSDPSKKAEVLDKITEVVSGIIGSIAKEMDAFAYSHVEVNGALGDLGAIVPEEYSDLQDFMEAVIPDPEGMVPGNPEFKRIAGLVLADYVLKAISTDLKNPSLVDQKTRVGTSMQLDGKQINTQTGISKGVRPITGDSGNLLLQRITADVVEHFDSQDSAHKAVKAMGSKAPPSRLRGLQEAVFVSKKDSSSGSETQVGAMTYHKYSTEEVQNVMSQHMSAMKELGAPKERVDSYLESMSKQRATREVAHKVFERDAFIKPHNVSERDWKKGTTFQGTMDTFKAYGDSLLANDPLKEVYRSTVEKMGAFLDKHGESIQKAPVSEVRILKKNVYNLTMAMGETEEDRTTRLAMSMLYSGAATQETIANFNFLGKESMSIAQSQFLDLPMAKLLKGKFANVKAVQNENGVNLVDQNSGKSLYSVRDQINSAGQFETVGRISKSEIIKTHPKGRKGLQEDHLSDIRPLVVEVLHEVFEKILVA